MTPRAAATIGVRVVALWLFVQALLGVITVLVTFVREYALSPSALAEHAAAWYVLRNIAMELLAGLLLFALSRPIGRFIARRVE